MDSSESYLSELIEYQSSAIKKLKAKDDTYNAIIRLQEEILTQLRRKNKQLLLKCDELTRENKQFQNKINKAIKNDFKLRNLAKIGEKQCFNLDCKNKKKSFCKYRHPRKKCLDFPHCEKGALFCDNFHPYCSYSTCKCMRMTVTSRQYHHMFKLY